MLKNFALQKCEFAGRPVIDEREVGGVWPRELDNIEFLHSLAPKLPIVTDRFRVIQSLLV